jgi:hypothetical protein
MSNLLFWSPQQLIASGKYPLTMGQIRHLLLHKHKNGLQDAVYKVGKRLMFRVDLFDRWLEKQKEGKNG